MSLFETSGSNLIEKALGQFESVKQKLLEGAQKCLAQVHENETTVSVLQAESAALSDQVEKAQRAVRGIDNLLNGG